MNPQKALKFPLPVPQNLKRVNHNTQVGVGQSLLGEYPLLPFSIKTKNPVCVREKLVGQ